MGEEENHKGKKKRINHKDTKETKEKERSKKENT